MSIVTVDRGQPNVGAWGLAEFQKTSEMNKTTTHQTNPQQTG